MPRRSADRPGERDEMARSAGRELGSGEYGAKVMRSGNAPSLAGIEVERR